MNEVELKLALPEAWQRSFQRLAFLKTAEARKTERLVSVYYDTPRLDLRRRGIALRIRRQGARWLQTVKCAGSTGGGLSFRPEWENAYHGQFDFSAVEADGVRAVLERQSQRSRIAPVFETNFLRTTWRFAPRPGAHVLVVLDRGWIVAAGRREAISEVEIELQDGAVTDVFDIAHRLAERMQLLPAMFSKAERGYRLFLSTPPAPVKGGKPSIAAGLAPVAAFRAIALDCLDHLQHNHNGAATLDDPEYIHQMRVATRRLRAGLRLFAPVLPADFAAQLLPELRTMMSLLGQARDLDVLLAEIVAPVLDALPAEPRLALLVGMITERSYERRAAVRHALLAANFGRLMLLATDRIYRLETTAACGEGAPATVVEFAASRMRRLRRKVLRLAEAASTDDPASLHALRIGIKRLRYGLEFFGPLSRGRGAARHIARLAGLQETLGQINDLASAGQLLMDCAGTDARLREAVALIGGWHGPRYAELLAGVPDGLAAIRRLRLPVFA